MKNKTRILVLVSALLIAANPIFATDGYFGLGYDTKSKGMAGAGVALYQNSFFGASNPAAMVWNGDKYGVSLGLFNPDRGYTVTGTPSGYDGTFGLFPGKVVSDSKIFPMPSMVGNWMLNETSSFGISLYGNGGMNTTYPPMTFGHMDSPTTGVNLMQMFGAFTYSVKLGDNWSVGLSGILAWQSFEAKGLANFGPMSSDATKLTNNGASIAFGYGAKIGIQGEVTEGLFFGATFQTKMNMGAFTEYAGLFAEAGDFDIPANWTIGLAYELVPNKLIVAADYKQILYSKVNSIGNPMNMSAALGMEAGSGFGWEDMKVFKVGVEYIVDDEWKLRTGFSSGNSPVNSANALLNIIAPGVIENHITFGFSKIMGSKEINVAIVRALRNTVTGPNAMDPVQTIDLTMAQWELEIGITF